MASRRPVRGLSPDVARADVSQLQIFSNSFSTGAAGVKIAPTAAVHGHIGVPGDKSLSHRARAARGDLRGRDPRSPASAAPTTPSRRSPPSARSGSEVYEADTDTLRVFGAGLRGLVAPKKPIDCGNAGTLMRLLPGILAGQEGRFELTGDDSLRSRPMERIAEPLRQMGASIETEDGHAPIVIEGGSLKPISLRAAGRERAGQVGGAARRPLRGGRRDDRRGASAHARPHGEHAGAGGRAGSPASRRA